MSATLKGSNINPTLTGSIIYMDDFRWRCRRPVIRRQFLGSGIAAAGAISIGGALPANARGWEEYSARFDRSISANHHRKPAPQQRKPGVSLHSVKADAADADKQTPNASEKNRSDRAVRFRELTALHPVAEPIDRGRIYRTCSRRLRGLDPRHGEPPWVSVLRDTPAWDYLGQMTISLRICAGNIGYKLGGSFAEESNN